MKTICLLMLTFLTSTSTSSKKIELQDQKSNVPEILKNWNYQQKRLDVKISKVNIGVEEIKFNKKQ